MAVQSDFLPCLWKVAATEQVGVKECLFRKISASLTSGKSWLLLYRFYLIVFKDTFHGLGLSLKQFEAGMTVELWLCLVWLFRPRFGPCLLPLHLLPLAAGELPACPENRLACWAPPSAFIEPSLISATLPFLSSLLTSSSACALGAVNCQAALQLWNT